MALASDCVARLGRLAGHLRPTILRQGGDVATITVSTPTQWVLGRRDGSPVAAIGLHSSCTSLGSCDTPIQSGCVFPDSGSHDSSARWWMPRIITALEPLRPELPGELFCAAAAAGADRPYSEQARSTFNWNPSGMTAGGQSSSLVCALGRRGTVRVGTADVPRYELAVYRSYTSADEGARAFAAMWAANIRYVLNSGSSTPTRSALIIRALDRWTGSRHGQSDVDRVLSHSAGCT